MLPAVLPVHVVFFHLSLELSLCFHFSDSGTPIMLQKDSWIFAKYLDAVRSRGNTRPARLQPRRLPRSKPTFNLFGSLDVRFARVWFCLSISSICCLVPRTWSASIPDRPELSWCWFLIRCCGFKGDETSKKLSLEQLAEFLCLQCPKLLLTGIIPQPDKGKGYLQATTFRSLTPSLRRQGGMITQHRHKDTHADVHNPCTSTCSRLN